MVVYATHEHGYNKDYEPIMTWHRAEIEPTEESLVFLNLLPKYTTKRFINVNKSRILRTKKERYEYGK